MPDIINIISPGIYGAHLDQLAMLAQEGDPVFCAGNLHYKTDLKVTELPCGLLAGKTSNALAREITSRQIIHAWDIPSALIAARAAKKTSGRLVVSLGHIGGLEKPLAKLFGKLHGIKAHITLPTQASLEKLKSLMAHSRIATSVLPIIACETANPDQTGQSVRDKLGFQADDFLMAGITTERKYSGYLQVGYIHGIAREFIDNIKLVLPVTGRRAEKINNYSRNTGSDREIITTGNTFSPRELIGACDVGLFLHIRDCGTAAIIEAAACGKPIILSNLPEITELFADIDDQHKPDLVDQTQQRIILDKIDDIIQNPQSALQRAEVIQKFVLNKYTPSSARNELDRVYSSMSG